MILFELIIRKTIKIIGGIVLTVLYYLDNKKKTSQKVIKFKMSTKTPLPTKNKWLYTKDDFGKMEKGLGYDE